MKPSAPTISVMIESNNYPQQLKPVIDNLGLAAGKANENLKNAKGSTSLEHSYKNIIHDTAKLEMLKLKDSETENTRYGIGGSHLWISVRNEDNQWERIAIVTFENFA